MRFATQSQFAASITTSHVHLETFLLPQIKGVTIAIGGALLANLLHFRNKGRDLYLSYYDGLHDLQFDKVTVHPFWAPRCRKEHHSRFKARLPKSIL